jgi:hypothetical protein
MRNCILIVLPFFLFSSFISLAQVKELKHAVYFDKDKHVLRQDQKVLLDTLLQRLKGKDVSKITLSGHTDSDASDEYNVELSKNRLNRVRKYLESKGTASTIMEGSFLGESQPAVPNLDETGMSRNRRVEIIVSYKAPSSKPAQELAIDSVKPPCPEGDTTFYLPEGTRYTLTLCDFLKNPDGFKVKEYIKPESILRSGFTTQTTGGEQLATGGMFDITICEGCLSEPMIVRVPVEEEPEGREAWCDTGGTKYRIMSLWSGDNHGRWESDTTVKKVTINDTVYYEFTVKRTAITNLDYKLAENYKKAKKVKFKAKKGIELTVVRLLFQMPNITQYEGIPHKKRKNIMFVYFHRCPRPKCEIRGAKVYAEGINENRDSLAMPVKELNYLKYRKAWGKCRLGKKRYSIFDIRRPSSVYRKYIIKPLDMQPKNRNKIVRAQ